ncbi:MAG: hypothetical protein C0631_09380 [Sedimenticola sp.]|nr:MAG: hypothetical protein C0631_09380 [Sedimenticola sp.]
MSDSEVSVISVNFNGGSFLANAVEAVLSSNISIELFLCDNDSIDGSFYHLKSLLRQCSYRHASESTIQYLDNHLNLGFSKANNIAIKQASGDFILLLNPDCVVQPDTLSKMLNVMNQHPEAGMAGCRILNEDGTEQAGCRRQLPTPMSGLLRSFNLRKFTHSKAIDLNNQPLPDHPVEVEAISGAFMLLRKSAIDDVGLMDESYFLHCEDLDYCKRFQDKGWKILFVPDVTVTHYKGTCSSSRPVRVEWHKHRGMIRYYDKFLAKQNPVYLGWLVRVGIAARFLLVASSSIAKRSLTLFTRQTKNATLDVGELTTLDYDEIWPKCLAGRSVLVTGATGFVGRRLVDALLQVGAKVSLLTRQDRETAELSDASEVSVFHGDLTTGDGLDQACAGVDTIFHLASYSMPHEYEGVEEDDRHFDVTVTGTRNLLQSAKTAGVGQVVFASTVRAADDFSELNNYGRAKLQAEQLLLDAAEDSDLKVSVLRFPVIYGSVKRGNIFRMMTAIDRGRFPAIPEFHNRRSMIHRDDAVTALIQSACSEKTSGRVFVVTDGESYSSRRIYLSIRAALGKAPSSLYIPVLILRAAARAGDAYARVFKRPFPINTALLDKISGSAEYDGSAFAEEIGFQACYNLESALPTMVSQYRQGSGD